MSVSNGQPGNAAIFNGAFVSKSVNSTTIGQVTLSNTDPSSGSSVSNIQRELNAFSSYTGKATNIAFDSIPGWADNTIGASSDSLFSRIEAIQTRVGGKTAGGVLFGSLEQDASNLFWNDTTNRLGIGTNAPGANFDLSGRMAIRAQTIAPTGTYLNGIASSFVLLSSAASGISRIENNGTNDFLFIANKGSADIIFDTPVIGLTTGEILSTFTVTQNSMSLVAYDNAASGWIPLAGGGGSGGESFEASIAVINNITLNSGVRRTRRKSSGGSPQTLAQFDMTNLVADDDGLICEVWGSSDTITYTIPTTATGIGYMNGEWVGVLGSVIAFEYDHAALHMRELYRNGI